MDKVKIGPLTLFYWALAVGLTAALIFLNILQWQDIQIPFLLFFAVPTMFTITFVFAKGGGVTRESVLGPYTFIASAISLIILFVNVWVLGQIFHYTPNYSVSLFDASNQLVAVLYAIYEESLILSIAVLFAVSGRPAVGLLFSDLLFLGLHALRYPATWYFDSFLLVGRSIMSGAFLITGNSDVPYTVHVLYNLVSGG